jgi:hypothetical protein
MQTQPHLRRIDFIPGGDEESRDPTSWSRLPNIKGEIAVENVDAKASVSVTRRNFI